MENKGMKYEWIRIFLLLFLISTSVLYSCKDKNELKSHRFKSFPETIQMSPQLLDSFSLERCLDPNGINIYDTLLIITQNRMSKGIFNIYSLKTNKLLASFGEQGKGAGEFLNPASPEIDKVHGLLWFIDYPKRTFYAFRISEIVNNPMNASPVVKILFDQSLMPVYNFIVLEDTSIMIPTTDSANLYTIINTKGEIVERMGNQPMFDSDGLPKFAYCDLHSRFIAYNTDAEEVVFTYLYYDKILKYSQNENNYNIVTGPRNIVQKAQAKEDGALFRPVTIEEGYYQFLKSNKEKIFALYTGKAFFNSDFTPNFPYNIHVFNWDLEPVSNLQFSKNIRAFDINESGDLLYTITVEDTENIRVYSLK